MTAAPSVLPATGLGMAPDVRTGDLGAVTQALSGRAPEPPGSSMAGRAWTLTPSIGLTEEYVTGGSGTGGGLTDQFITTLQPALALSGDTARLHGELSYTPQILLYSRDGSQNQVDQDFQSRLLATLLPGSLFLDLRGAGAVQAVAAAQAPQQFGTLGRDATTQTYSFSASPYAVHRFGPWGSGEIGGSLARTTQNAQAAVGQTEFGPRAARPLAALADAANQNVTTTSLHAAFTTGEAFARYNAASLAQATDFAGSGVLRGAYRDIATVDNGYALSRTITALGLVGWERIHYAGSAPVQIDDAVWNLGLRLEPAADSSLTVRYGHRDGLNALTVDAALQPTARTRLYARYSTGLTTHAEQLQNALATSDLDTQGNPVDHTTGAPLVAAGTFFGIRNSVFKTSLASLTGVLLLDRDSLSLNLSSQTQTLISASSAGGLAGGDSRGVFGAFTWTHLLRPALQSTLFAQYGVQTGGVSDIPGGRFGLGGQGGEQRLLVLSASLSYALTPTLSGQAQYSFNQSFAGQSFGGQSLGGQSGGGQSLVLISLIKSF